jgi:filamentous hemagglutinin family protein
MTIKFNSLRLLSSIILLGLGRASIASAQVLPDNTTNTLINGDCAANCTIEGGIKAGTNLFHSFQEFNVRDGAKVFFLDPNANNIFSRITGGNPSEIFGTLGVSGGNANLFLINSNGIIFGTNARLDLKGSFVATTANAVSFGDLGSFATKPSLNDNPALLTVNPSAFLFQQLQATENPNPIEVRQGAILEVQPQQNLSLLGDLVSFQGGNLTAPSGNIILGAVEGKGTIVSNELGKVEIAENVQKGDITLDSGSIIDVSGVGSGNIYLQGDRIVIDRGSFITNDTLGDLDGGVIAIEAKNLLIRDGGNIDSTAFGTGKGASISIDVTETFEIIGQEFLPFQQLLLDGLNGQVSPKTRTTGLFAGTVGKGDAGNIEISSENLILTNEAAISTPTFGDAAAGNIQLDIAELLEIRSSGLLTVSIPSTNGSAGDVNINTQRLLVRNGGIILTSTFGSGDGGDLKVFATDSIELRDTPPTAFLANGLYSSSVLGNGQGGNINLITNRLLVQNGSTIAAASGAFIRNNVIPLGGNSGNILIQVGDAIEVSGASSDGVFLSRINSDTIGQGNAGNLTIETGSFQLIGSAYVSASSFNGGRGGNLTIEARDFVHIQGLSPDFFQQFIVQALAGGSLDISQGRGFLFTGTISTGDAGDTTISTPYLLLENGGAILTSSFGAGKSGSLSIQADRIDVISSIINAGAFGTGDSSDITIDTKTLNIINNSTIATTTINTGNAGNVIIRATEAIDIYNDKPRVFSTTDLTGIYTNSIGGANAGNIEIDTKNLILRDGGTIASQSVPNPFTLDSKGGSSGNLMIRAQSIEIEGNFFDGLVSSGLFTSTLTNGKAGDLQVTTDILKLSDTGIISVNSNSLGEAGNLIIDAKTIQLDSGKINASTISGVGGNIDIQARSSLLLQGNSQIDANAQGIGDGGNIKIATIILLLLDRSQISTSAIEGNGGKINLYTQGLFRSAESMLEASSQLGIDGIISIDTPEIDPNNGLIELSEQTTQPENKIAQTCGNNSSQIVSSFVIIGKGGLSEQPQQIRHNLPVLSDLGIGSDEDDRLSFTNTIPAKNLESASIFIPQPTFIEARGWLKGDRGQIILTAAIEPSNSTNYSLDRPITCR